MFDDSIATGATALHRADPRMKLLGLVPFAFTVALVQEPAVAALGLAVALLLYLSIRPGMKSTLRRLTAVNVFVVFFWVIVPPTYGGEAAFSLGPVQFSMEGLRICALVTLKTNALLFAFAALACTHSPIDLGLALQQLRFPEKLCRLLVFSYRYIFDTRLEFLRLQRAANMRCFRPGTNRHTYTTIAHLLAATLLRSYDRADQVHKAMLLRGFGGSFHSLKDFSAGPFSYALVIGLALFSGGLAWLEWSV